MKKVLLVFVLALLALTPFVSARLNEKEQQKELYAKVDNLIKTPADYENLINLKMNKVEYVKGLLPETKGVSYGKLFRAVHHSSGFKMFSAMVNGRRLFNGRKTL